jgi:hypothetical protein
VTIIHTIGQRRSAIRMSTLDLECHNPGPCRRYHVTPPRIATIVP